MKLGSGQSSTRGLRFNVVAIEYPKQSRLAVRAQIGFHPQGETSPPAFWNTRDLRNRRVAEITICLGVRDRMKLGLVGSGAYRRQTQPRS